MSVVNQKSYVASAGKKGRGVFARKRLKAGEVIEISPFIELPPSDYYRCRDTVINEYRYEVRGRKCAIGLGLTSIYNHSVESNANFSLNARKRTITIKALKSISRDEEITINYGYKLQ